MICPGGIDLLWDIGMGPQLGFSYIVLWGGTISDMFNANTRPRPSIAGRFKKRITRRLGQQLSLFENGDNDLIIATFARVTLTPGMLVPRFKALLEHQGPFAEQGYQRACSRSKERAGASPL